MITQSKSYEQLVFNGWRKAEMIYILLKQFFRLDVQFWSRGAEEVPWLEGFIFQSDLTLDQFSGEASAHPEEQDLQRNGRIHHLKQLLKSNAHYMMCHLPMQAQQQCPHKSFKEHPLSLQHRFHKIWSFTLEAQLAENNLSL